MNEDSTQGSIHYAGLTTLKSETFFQGWKTVSMHYAGHKWGSIFILLLTVLLETAAVQQAVGQGLQVNPSAITMRRLHPQQYEPEQLFTCSLVLDGMDARNLKALGVRETIPLGWEFTGLNTSDAPPPAVVPPAGATGTLEFAWVDPPAAFPYTLVYTVRPPADASGQQFFHGAVEYRLLGGAQYAPPVVTSVSGPDNPPSLILLGDNPVEIQAGTPWSDPGYTATDGRGQDVTNQVRVSGTVDPQTPGTYSLEYRLELPGQQTVTATRSVIVTEVNDQTADQSPAVQRPGGASPLPPPLEGRRNTDKARSPQEAGAAHGTSEQTSSGAVAKATQAAGQSPLPELPSLDALRPLDSAPDRTRREITVGLTPAQRAALPPEALRPYPPGPDVDPDAVRADVLRIIRENELTAQPGTSDTGSAESAAATVPPEPVNWLALGLGIGTALILGGSGVLAGKLVYGRPAWRGPRPPVSR